MAHKASVPLRDAAAPRAEPAAPELETASQPLASAPRALAALGISGGGQPLDDDTRSHFETQFGRDFAGVRIHRDVSAVHAARALDAKAFTSGSHIVFGRGRYRPQSAEGRRLLSHELTHVVQQGAATPSRIYRGALSPSTALRPIASAPSLQRDPVEPARPTVRPSVRVPFTDLPDGIVVSDPTGRTHGITLERRGTDLYYHLPDPFNATRKVPLPLDTLSDTPTRLTIEAVHWGGRPGSTPMQLAFTVAYSFILAPDFSVNIHGLGRFQSLLSGLRRDPADLEVRPEGLEIERAAGVLQTTRPSARRLRDAVRYHIPGAPYSLYVRENGNRRVAEVITDRTGRRVGGPWNDVENLQVSPAGAVTLVFHTRRGSTAITFDLSARRFSWHSATVPPASADRTGLLANLRGLGITIIERGSRFTDVELQAAWDLLQEWQGSTPVVQALRNQGAPGLTFIKDLSISGGSYNTDTGQLKVPGEVEMTPSEQRNLVIHELTHALFHARGLRIPDTGPVPPEVTTLATELEREARRRIDEGPVQPLRPPRTRRSVANWERTLSTNPELNRIWGALHHRFPIPDPEGTADIRGLDVADESRYFTTFRGDPVGHGFDNVTEFISSFVTSSLRVQAQMSATVQRSGSLTLARLYRDLWTEVDTELVNLGTTNPYHAVILAIRAAHPPPPAPETPAPPSSRHGLRILHGPRLRLGAEFAPGRSFAVGSLGYDLILDWSHIALTGGVRLDVPFDDRDAFVRAGLNVGANFRVLRDLYLRLHGGVTFPITEAADTNVLFGGGIGYRFGRVELELLYDVLRPFSEEDRVHRALLGVGFRFGR